MSWVTQNYIDSLHVTSWQTCCITQNNVLSLLLSNPEHNPMSTLSHEVDCNLQMMHTSTKWLLLYDMDTNITSSLIGCHLLHEELLVGGCQCNVPHCVL